jgi:ribosomal protein L11 methyltransferase
MVLFITEHGVPGVEMDHEDGDAVFVIYFRDKGAIDRLLTSIDGYCRKLEEIHAVSVSFDWEMDTVAEEDWRDAWKVHFKPSRVSPRLVVKPSWETADIPNGAFVLEIDPGQAFGTGLHATTRMCLECIDRILSSEGTAPPESALDVGTGTGILAIALAKLGVNWVWALDTDETATQAARTNVLANGVEHQVAVLNGSVERLEGKAFPLVVANLTGTALRQMRGDIIRSVLPGGWLLLSGLLCEEKPSVVSEYEGAGFCLSGNRQEQMWSSLLLRREC